MPIAMNPIYKNTMFKYTHLIYQYINTLMLKIIQLLFIPIQFKFNQKEAILLCNSILKPIITEDIIIEEDIIIIEEPIIIKQNVFDIKDTTKDKQQIISLFNTNVKGVEICLEGQNTKHDGREGHWLETKMNIKHNAKNEPDINGYEMKKASSKTTLGDFSASEYAFSGKNKRESINHMNNWTDAIKLNRIDFIRTFGNPNPIKNNRYSWSGTCVPKYNIWNANGQKILLAENNDIIIYYSYSIDTRIIKLDFPEFLKNDNIVIALWKAEKMKNHINNKFNKKGFFICKKIGNKYENICFGKPFNFEYFIKCIKNKSIIFDSGMYEGNSRNYSQFRGSSFWNELITEEY